MLEMLEVVFAWMGTGITYLVLPDANLSKMETVVSFVYIYFIWLYIYAALERTVRKIMRKKNAKSRSNRLKEVV